jgi:hypothetical protein
MKNFLSTFKNNIGFFYSSWDRMVINGYFTTLFRPEQLVHFLHNIAEKKCTTKEGLKEWTEMYNTWVNRMRQIIRYLLLLHKKMSIRKALSCVFYQKLIGNPYKKIKIPIRLDNE